MATQCLKRILISVDNCMHLWYTMYIVKEEEMFNMTEAQIIILEGLIELEERELTQSEYDSLIYEPVYTDIKMNEQDSGRYPE